MANSSARPSDEEWEKGRRLGSGTFGLVVLWTNKEKGTTLALKHYKGNMDQKNHDRWIQEVLIMKTLKHPNVVRAFDVPEQLKVHSSNLPVLAMEYCSGGDLRTVLSKPHSSYGLNQMTVNDIISQVADGMYYLHENNIIHRDLKPENIVLKPMAEDKVVYKIIDLGYAKDIGHGSIPQSFAGTLQYAAPDLLQKKPYSKSVDYWSLGILSFELINGRRPFSPVDNDPVVGWYNSITSKKPNTICMMEDINGNVTFSEHLPPYNNISSNLTMMYGLWLRSMLTLKPAQRGQNGPKDGIYASAPWYGMLKDILQVKEYRILDMTQNKLVVYIDKGIATVTDIHKKLEEDTGIPMAEQQLLLPDGKVALQTEQPEKRNDQDAEFMLPEYFLFRNFGTALEYEIDLKLAPLPPMAEKIGNDPSFVVKQSRIRCRSWAECLYVCKTMVDSAVYIQEGIRALKMNFMRQFKKMTSSRHKLTGVQRRLEGKHNFFKTSMTFDLDSYLEQKDWGVTSERMLNNWLASQTTFSEIPENLNICFKELCIRAEGLGQALMELRDYPLHTQHIDNLDTLKIQSEKLYQRLRQEMKGGQPKNVDCSELVEVMFRSRKEREKFGEGAAQQLETLLKYRADAIKIQQDMDDLSQQLESHAAAMMAAQKKRQSEIWMSLRYSTENYAKQKALNQRNVEMRQKEERAAADIGGPNTLTTPSYLTAVDMITSPTTLGGPPTLTTPSSLGASAPMTRDFTSLSAESMHTIHESASVQHDFSLAVDQYNYESASRLNDLKSLDWEFQ
ncbi:inhibitor of nuclear factor kappa-B kinase subunit beta-like [Apostichopus japonicus]|uniref:inhibitor of nuclear factor kappa-B kinase subunit beta-like n=1 Tax=Stichopus japonicus TaxID=307972 RepID=UPI003AB38D03